MNAVARRPLESIMGDARRILADRNPHLVIFAYEANAVDVDKDGDGILDPSTDTGPGQRPGYYTILTLAMNDQGEVVQVELANEDSFTWDATTKEVVAEAERVLNLNGLQARPLVPWKPQGSGK
ncbi:MAG: hypothetical protein ACF8XB_21845 [Planctomycetota bacterium JB042]